jgi:DNA-directed RNA polymerase subunit K/omega
VAGKRSVAEVALRSTGGAQVQKTLDGVGKATDRVGRSQTRLGQASASAGRQFSAQASGLGGLVAAYAGAAATIFAITAAFQALNAAARAEQTITGVNALASAIGESGPKIIAGLQEITKGQLSIVQTAELANLALSSGFSADQINNLAEISLKASRALGRDLTDSFNRLVRGVTKLEPELLDELGIFTRIEPAAERYAAQVGKVASQLSNFERRQAFANAVAAEGQEKFQDIDTSASTSSESLEKLAATLADIGQKVGAFIAGGLQPLVEALGQPITAIGAFGILARTVFGTTIREITGSLGEFATKIDGIADSVTDRLSVGSKKAALATQQFGEALQGVNLRVAKVSQANQEAFSSFIRLGRAGELTTSQTKQFRDVLEQEIASIKKAILNNAALEKRTKALDTAKQRLVNRERELAIALEATNTRLNTQSVVARNAARAIKFLGVAFVRTSNAVLGLFNRFTLIVTILSTVVAVGSTILQAFGWLDPVLEKISAATRALKIFLGIQKEVGKAAAAADALANSLLKIPDDFSIDLSGAGGRRGLGRGNEVDADEVREGVRKALIEGATGSKDEFINAVLKNIGGLNTTAAVQAVRTALEGLFGSAFPQGANIGTLLGIESFAEATGRTLKTVGKQLEVLPAGGLRFKKAAEQGLDIISQLPAQFRDTSTLQGEELKKAEAFNAALVNRLQSQEVASNLQTALNTGAATAEQIEKRRGAILAKINNLKESGNQTDQATAEFLERQLEAQNRQVEAQLAILDAREKIRKTFSADIAAAGKVSEFFNIQVSDAGEILEFSKRTSDERASQVQRLEEAFSLGKEQLAQERAGVKLQGEAAQLAALARDAQTAYVGQFTKAVEAAEKLANALEKIVKSQDDATKLAEAQLTIFEKQREIADLQQGDKETQQALKGAQQQLKVEEKRLQLTKQAADIDIKRRGEAVDRSLAKGVITESQARVFKLTLAKESLDALREFTEGQISILQQRAQAETEAIEAQRQSLVEQKALIDERDFLEYQRIIEQQKISRDNALREVDLLEAENKLIQAQTESFGKHVQGIADVLAADIVQRKVLMAADNPGQFAADATANAQAALAQGGSQAAAVRGAFANEGELQAALARGFTEAEARRTELATTSAGLAPNVQAELDTLTQRLKEMGFAAARTAIETNAAKQVELEGAKLAAKTADEKAAIDLKIADLDLKKKDIADQLGLSIDELNQKLADSEGAFVSLTQTTATANNTMTQLKMGVRDAIVDGLGRSVDLLFQNIADGKPVMEGLQEQLRGVFENVRKQVLQKTLIEPLQEKLTSGLNNMLGISGEKGADNAGLVGDALKTYSVNESGTDFTTDFKEKATDGVDSVIDKMKEFGEKGKEIFSGFGDKLGSVFSSIGNSLGTSGPGGGGFFGKIFGGLSSVLGFGGQGTMTGAGGFTDGGMFSGLASGGFVPFSAYQRLAAGGQARDRVPALLEPGEFVMKRSSANSIGAPALNQMNATGKAGGNVVVNIKNEGTPQDATASEPRFDGEKFVIDIVTRDLRNNGPIRKSLRGGGAG